MFVCIVCSLLRVSLTSGSSSCSVWKMNRLDFAGQPACASLRSVDQFLPARCYASVGTSYGSVSVCLSVTSRCSIEMDGRIELDFGM